MRDLKLVSFLYIVNSTGGISPVECKKKEIGWLKPAEHQN